MMAILSDPVNLIVIGLALLLLAGPSVYSIGKKALVRKVDPMRQIADLKSIRKSVPPEISTKIDDVCRAIFEESLK